MNERIKELAEQAGMTVDKYGMFFAKDFDSHCADGVDLEKFAELIVRRTLKVTGATPSMTETVKKYFGIE